MGEGTAPAQPSPSRSSPAGQSLPGPLQTLPARNTAPPPRGQTAPAALQEASSRSSALSWRSHYFQPQSHCSLYSPTTAAGAQRAYSYSLQLGFSPPSPGGAHLERPQLPARLTTGLVSPLE